MLINAHFSTMEVKAKLEATSILYKLKVNDDSPSHRSCRTHDLLHIDVLLNDRTYHNRHDVTCVVNRVH